MKASSDGFHKIFSCHHGRIGFYFESDTQSQNDATDQQDCHFHDIGRRFQPEEHEHGEVDEQAEAERNGYLKQVHPQVFSQLPACHQKWFEDNEQQVEQNGPYTHCEGRKQAQYVGYTRDGRRAQQRFGDEGNAECIDEQ